MTDYKIINAYWERSENAIQMTLEVYYQYLLKIGMNILHSKEDAEECINDVMLKTWHAIPPNRPEKFSAFIGKLMRHRAIDQYRKYQSLKRKHLDVILDELQMAIPDNMEETLIFKDAINHFLASLKKEQRMIFVRRYWYGDSIKAIAKRYKLGQSKVKTSLFRSRQQLHLHLMEEA